ncbi:M50 family metallopeptidase [Spirulina sp. 06S082]|uniref:M50 family metallopeptidase n=1 Tax=Spirulina sp. 06S082 TaxID=3110248 RepID=UPI002B216FDC|nr:M50 family metallopeptidase [Spirulina sp. 06S082]MEA5469071.1 M50 family metallopeptidase [Spirulina sp. 06S082]
MTVLDQNPNSHLCPDLRDYWQLVQRKEDKQRLLKSTSTPHEITLSAEEDYALRHFTGQFNVTQIQKRCQQKYPNISPTFIEKLCDRLLTEGILTENIAQPYITLKPEAEWIEHPAGYWLLRNPKGTPKWGLIQKKIPNLVYLFFNQYSYETIQLLEQFPLETVVDRCNYPSQQLQQQRQILAATGMLAGIDPPAKKGFSLNPLQLLYLQIPLFDPDTFLSLYGDRLSWLWTKMAGFCLALFLTSCAIVGWNQRLEIAYTGAKLWESYSNSLILPFIFLSLFVVVIHELGHAFTLKHFGGIVPEIGLLLMMLFPAAYTNTTDSYRLPRWQRLLVVGAGLLVQLTIAAIALTIWNFAIPGSALQITSYLLLIAALFTLAVNLNPLAKFDGYYFLVALTGILNLRSRARAFYFNLFTGKPLQEPQNTRWILAIYGPLSLLYLWFIFGFLILRILQWFWVNLPQISQSILLIALIYWLFSKLFSSSR